MKQHVEMLTVLAMLGVVVDELPVAADVFPTHRAQLEEMMPVRASEIATLEAAAEGGDSLAQSRLGFAYSLGNGGLVRSRAKAVELWEKAADLGRPAAESILGTEYYFGDNEAKITLDRQKGMLLWHKAAAQGNTEAKSQIAVAYAQGLYIPIDADEELQLKTSMEQIPELPQYIDRLQTAAESGDAFAQSRLGFTYQFKNPALAVSWWAKAAEQGRMPAQRALGFAYHNGNGVAQDNTRAVMWWHKATAQGDNQAKFELARAFRDGKYTPANSDEASQLKSELERQDIERQDEEKRGWLSGIAR